MLVVDMILEAESTCSHLSADGAGVKLGLIPGHPQLLMLTNLTKRLFQFEKPGQKLVLIILKSKCY